jgi:predicted XRE-type DNA-binding protein
LEKNPMKIGSAIPMPRKRKSPRVTPELAAKIKALLATNMCQHDIAAFLRINQGRVSEVNTGMKFADVEAAQIEMVFD